MSAPGLGRPIRLVRLSPPETPAVVRLPWKQLLSIDRREQIAIDRFAYLFYYGRLGDIGGRPSSLSGYDHSFIHSLNLGDHH
ncbi:hypothetical protein RND71_018078 [Anisodus tanguticus]|uniref:Uncharacterized protein n=1 Tax=Anisodus tanguticus TaxID=243964 RepID=A0AAE1S4Y3_9SOLA|nr:hypothetical protein RND71_018078 [Anisodus tanguticus]